MKEADPTTAGDFCRRLTAQDIDTLQEVFNEIRVKVWRQQPPEFFDEAILEADGTMVETTGECQGGMDINHKGQWGYHPLMVSLANTGEPLYVVNRSGARPSHEGAAEYFNKSIGLCRRAGFKKITLRGDTDFTQTAYLDAWDDQGDVRFVFGIDAMSNLYEKAENLPERAWKRLRRRKKHTVKTTPRARPANVKEQIVKDREFKNIRLMAEYVAEFEYSPTLCKTTYRVVVVWKDLEVTPGQKKLFDDSKCFFYITNDWQSPAEAIVFDANDRCNQENLIGQHKSGVRSLTAPVDNLLSNWAYMVMASLAWSLKAWSALLLMRDGPLERKTPHRKADAVADGLRDFSQRDDQHAGADCSRRSSDCGSSSVVEPLARRVVSIARSIGFAATPLARQIRSRGQDAPVHHHVSPRKFSLMQTRTT